MKSKISKAVFRQIKCQPNFFPIENGVFCAKLSCVKCNLQACSVNGWQNWISPCKWNSTKSHFWRLYFRVMTFRKVSFPWPSRYFVRIFAFQWKAHKYVCLITTLVLLPAFIATWLFFFSCKKSFFTAQSAKHHKGQKWNRCNCILKRLLARMFTWFTKNWRQFCSLVK